MKTARKVLLLALCAILLVSATIMGTMAYLTKTTGTVRNTFTIGNVSFADNALDEANTDVYGNPLDEDGNIVDVEDAVRDTGNTYKLIPGHTYIKDPTIHMSDDTEDCYLFVEVVNDIADLEDADNTIADQMDKNGWENVTGNIYVYVGTEEEVDKAAVGANEDIPVFETFTLATDADLTLLNTDEEDNVTNLITIIAYAVQADGLENMAPDDIWTNVFEASSED